MKDNQLLTQEKASLMIMSNKNNNNNNNGMRISPKVINSQSPHLTLNNNNNNALKREKSNSISIIDYCNLMSYNSNYQVLANICDNSTLNTLYNVSDEVFEEPSIISNSQSIQQKSSKLNSNKSFQQSQQQQQSKSVHRLSLSNTPSSSSSASAAQVQRQSSVAEQIADFYDSYTCSCNFCRARNSASTSDMHYLSVISAKKFNAQCTFEIVPHKHDISFSVMKYTYTAPLSQISALKLFNLFNTDCNITSVPEIINLGN
jgi:hypothetical protein